MQIAHRNRQQGFTFIEMSIALVIVGISMMMLWQFVGRQVQMTAETNSKDLLVRAQKSLVSFAFVNGRLPCPASSTTGLENCSLRAGRFPFITAGLPEASAGKILYTLGAGSVSPAPVWVMAPAVVNGEVTAAPVSRAGPAGSLLGLCQALMGNSGATNSLAFQLRPDTAVPFAQKLASPSQTLSNGQLASRLYCQQHFGPSARAHPNVQIAAAALLQSMKDFHAQKDLTTPLIASDVAGLSYTLANAIWTWTRTVPQVLNAWSSFQRSLEINYASLSAVLVPMAQIVSDTVSVVRQASNVSRAVALLTINLDLIGNIEESEQRLSGLVADIGARAQTSANLGLQLDQAADSAGP